MRIIRFDHVSYIAANRDKENILNTFAGKKLKFAEIGIENPVSKRLLMRRKDQKVHDLYFFEGGGTDVEVILYDSIGGKSTIWLGKNTIYAECVDLERTAACFRILGIIPEKQAGQRMVYNLKGLLGKDDIYLEIQQQSKTQEVYLDDEGYGCAAFLVDSVSDLEKISDERNLITKTEKMNIHKRRLNVCFWKSMDLNIIFEFITVRKE